MSVRVGPEQIPWSDGVIGVAARVASWHLGTEDHGVVSINVDFDMGGMHQGRNGGE